MNAVRAGADAIGANAAHIPGNVVAAGYTTGTGGVPWSAADWAAHPGAVRICQDAGATDTTADVLDVERGAATPAEAPTWYRRALSNYVSNTRHGQRHPCIYMSASAVTSVANAMVAAGVTSGPRLWVALWGEPPAAAAAAIEHASGPYPIVAYQYANGPLFDSDLFDAAWLAEVSGRPAPPPGPPAPPSWVVQAASEAAALAALIKAHA